MKRSMKDFTDKIAIVTGAASGIGRALAGALCREGAMVVCADINIAGAKRTASDIVSTGGKAFAVRVDVTREEEVIRVIEETVKTHGRLDLIFNNAGIGIGGEVRDTTSEHWHRIMAVNLWGTIYGTLAAYRVMVGQGTGAIVNTASMAGLVPVPALAAYAAGKHAIVGLSTSLRFEAADLGVQVNVVCPGVVDTPILTTSEVLGVERNDLGKEIPFIISAETAASTILAGVKKNKAVIVFPLSNRLLWRFYRLWPAAVAPLSLKMVRDFRKFRKEK